MIARRFAPQHVIFLEDQPGFKVCGEAIDGVDALEKARYLSPELRRDFLRFIPT